LPTDEFVWAVCELAALDGSLGWLAAVYNAAAHEVSGLPLAAREAWDEDPRALITIGRRGSGDLAGGRLTGRWNSVVGTEHADWLLLSAGPARRVLVPRSRVHVEPTDGGLEEAGVGDVTVDDLAIDEAHVFGGGDRDSGLITGAGAAAAVVGTADGVWRTHVAQVRARLDFSYGGDEVTDEAAAEVARAASDIDAAKLQITGSLDAAAAWAFTQSVARARGAADRLLASSRHALDASDPVTTRWRDVHAGCRLADRILDELRTRQQSLGLR
jgi:3-hydroxy-9,10-secoandrosta-1,3,5(10)-triene-9,17-dione monooxygenase